jgi:pyridoxine 5-phosphate synthase
VRRLQDNGTKVSLFIDADPAQIQTANRLGAVAIEIHTGRYADANDAAARAAELERVRAGAALGQSLGLIVNAGTA